jgi:hypothetical protein
MLVTICIIRFMSLMMKKKQALTLARAHAYSNT